MDWQTFSKTEVALDALWKLSAFFKDAEKRDHRCYAVLQGAWGGDDLCRDVVVGVGCHIDWSTLGAAAWGC